MFKPRVLTRLCVCTALAALMVLSACNIPTSPAATLPATATPAGASTQAGQPTPTPGAPTTTAPQAASPTTVAPTESQPTTPPTEAPTQGQAGEVITAQNAANLKPTSLTLPEYPMQLLWVPKGAALPASLSSAANLLARTESKVYPIQVEPPAFGQGVTLNIPGQIQAFAPDLSSAITRTESGKFVLYRLDGTLIYTFDAPDPYGANYSADGKLAAITSANEHAVTLYEISTGKALTRLTGFESAAPVYAVGIVPGNQTIYWIARATLRFQDVASGQMGASLNYTDFIGTIIFSPDGKRLYLYVEGKLRIIKVPSGEQTAEITLSQPLSSLSLSPDGKLLAGGYGPNLQIWDAATLAPVAGLPGPNTSTGGVTFSPDGRYLATVHEGNIVNLWKVTP